MGKSDMLVSIPTKKELQAHRAFKGQDLIPEEDNWDGWLGKDNRGIYTFQKVESHDLSEYKGEKIYIEDFYNLIESMIIGYYQKAEQLFDELKTSTGFSGIYCVMQLLQIECSLIILHRYHKNPPSKKPFLTPEALDEILINETTLSDYAEYIMTINTDKVKTPLRLGEILKRMFKNSNETKSLVCLFSFTSEDLNLKTALN